MEAVLERELVRFLDDAGYSDEDVLSYNPQTRKVSLRNGGLYKITETGKILHLGGPSPDPTERM